MLFGGQSKTHRKGRRRRREWSTVAFGITAALGLLVALGFLGFFGDFFARDGSPLLGVPQDVEDEVTAAQEALTAEVTVYLEDVEARGAREDAVARLNAFIQAQEALVARAPELYIPGPLVSLNRALRQARDPIVGEDFFARSQAAARRAEAAERGGEAAQAQAEWEEAARLQRSINADFAESPRRDPLRLALLEEHVLRLALAPRQAAIGQAIARAAEARAAQQWAEATAAYDAALTLQQAINRAHQGTRHADPGREAVILQSRQEVREEMALADFTVVRAEAEAATARGDHAVAAALYADALQRIDALAEVAGGLTPGLQAQRDVLDVAQQTAASQPRMAELRAVLGRIDAALRADQPGTAADFVAQALRLAQRMQAEFPRSELREGPMLARLRYLRAMNDSWSDVWRRVADVLRPLPGHTVMLADREVSQAFFALLTGETPAGGNPTELPVFSVRWDQAAFFCERLSWLLGRPVRLPTVVELNAALGDPPLEQVTAQAWHSQNTDQLVQPVASLEALPGGFYDLLGNVAEWTSDGGDSPAHRIVWGGTVRDNPIRLNRVPTESRPASNPSRFIGFRFVVEEWGTP